MPMSTFSSLPSACVSQQSEMEIDCFKDNIKPGAAGEAMEDQKGSESVPQDQDQAEMLSNLAAPQTEHFDDPSICVPEILDNVLSHLNQLQDLKNCVQVNSHWLNVGAPHIRHLTYTHLKKDPYRVFSEWDESSSLVTNLHHSVKIDISEDDDIPNFSRNVSGFLTKEGHGVTKMKIVNQVEKPSGNLQNLKIPFNFLTNLETLSIKSESFLFDPVPPEAKGQLKSLEKLSLAIRSWKNEEQEEDSKRMLENLLEIGENLPSIKFGTQCGPKIPCVAIDLLTEKDHLLPNLEEITLKVSCDLRKLQVLERPLKRLTLSMFANKGQMGPLGENWTRVLENILKKNADLLELLDLYLPLNVTEELKMPEMKELKVLRLTAFDCGRMMATSKNLELFALFQDVELLEKTLPKLHTLQIVFFEEKYRQTLYDKLFPQANRGQIFPRIRTLVVDSPKQKDAEWRERLARKFPNVCNNPLGDFS